jgi:plastocyanin
VKLLRPFTVAFAVAATLLTACADDGPQPPDAAPPEQSPPEQSQPEQSPPEQSPPEQSPPPQAPPPQSPSAPPSPADRPEGSVPARPTVTVQSIDNTFRPDRIEVAPGTEVIWVNRGRNEHDISSESGFGVAADDFQPGDEYRYVFTEAGEYPYHCTIHGTETIGMIGTVVVTDQA